ncbi:MAG TPA: polysaccharide deacetylase family protein, partial [Geobacteraceae bacterium]
MFLRLLLVVLVIVSSALPAVAVPASPVNSAPAGVNVPILLYHRFGPTVADGMTITTPVFESH